MTKFGGAEETIDLPLCSAVLADGAMGRWKGVYDLPRGVCDTSEGVCEILGRCITLLEVFMTLGGAWNNRKMFMTYLKRFMAFQKG